MIFFVQNLSDTIWKFIRAPKDIQSQVNKMYLKFSAFCRYLDMNIVPTRDLIVF